MNDAFRMRGVKGLGDLTSDRERVGDGQRTACEAIRKRRTLDELEHQRNAVVDVLQPVDGADVGMIERREQTRLAGEARAALRIGREVPGQDLDRDVPIEPGVAGAIDLAHAARAQPSGHGVGPSRRPVTSA